MERSVLNGDERQHSISDVFAFRVIGEFKTVEDVFAGMLTAFDSSCHAPVYKR